MNSGKLREDLFYRLNVFAIDLPPLRERREDIPLLVQTFLTEFNRTNGKGIRAVDQEAMYILERYPWPGNIRELRNVIERATILAESEFIEPRHLPPTLISRGEASLPTLTISPGHDGRRGGTAADPPDARSHAQQQDARGGDSRHQFEDAAQQTEPDEGRRRDAESGGRRQTIAMRTMSCGVAG